LRNLTAKNSKSFRYGFIVIATALTLGFYLNSCGSEEEQVITQKGSGSASKPKWAEIAPLVAKECVNCHNGAKHPLNLSTQAAWDNSKSKARIANDSMPPNKKLEPSVKEKFLSYF
jgi:hypothetical protein